MRVIENTKIEVLDCTFRDGGYYNQWDFSSELAHSYINAMESAGVSAIELGFRFLPTDKFLGPNAYTTDEYIESLNIPRHMNVFVMVNAKELLAYKNMPEVAVSSLFRESSLSPVDIVRMACHFSDIEKGQVLAEAFDSLKYPIFVQLMQVAGKSNDEIVRAIETIALWPGVQAIYFADSLGSMNPTEVQEKVALIRSKWSGSVGIHTHDNMSRALDNSLAAIEAGVTWIDGTILGMGRGPGNVRTENLLIELVRRELGDYSPDALIPLVIQEFANLQKLYGWGANLLYYISGLYGIHPTYIQELLNKDEYETHHILVAVEYLKGIDSSSFRRNVLEQAVLGDEALTEGTWVPLEWIKGNDVLVIAPGEGSRKYRDGICRFIQSHKPVVIALNSNTFFPAEFVDAYATCHKSRLILDFDRLRKLHAPIIIPAELVPKEWHSKMDGMEIHNYGMQVKKDSFEVRKTSCTIPNMLGAAYIFSIAIAGGASRIFLTGFDGFGPEDPRHNEMTHMLSIYDTLFQKVPLIALTPTMYPIQQGSVYAQMEEL